MKNELSKIAITALTVLTMYVGMKRVFDQETYPVPTYTSSELIQDGSTKFDYKGLTAKVVPEIGPTGLITEYEVSLHSGDTVETVQVYKNSPSNKSVSIDSSVHVLEPNPVNSKFAPLSYDMKFNEAPFRRLTQRDLDSIIGLADKYLK